MGEPARVRKHVAAEGEEAGCAKKVAEWQHIRCAGLSGLSAWPAGGQSKAGQVRDVRDAENRVDWCGRLEDRNRNERRIFMGIRWERCVARAVFGGVRGGWIVLTAHSVRETCRLRKRLSWYIREVTLNFLKQVFENLGAEIVGVGNFRI